MFCVMPSNDQLHAIWKFCSSRTRHGVGEMSAFASLEYIKHCILALDEKMK